MNDIWQSCLRQNILEFKTGENSQRIPDSDLHPKKPLVRVRVRVRTVTGRIGYITAFQGLCLGQDFKRYPENAFLTHIWVQGSRPGENDRVRVRS